MKRNFTNLMVALGVGALLSVAGHSSTASMLSTAYNPQCTAIAKSTKKQCKNKQYGQCAKVLCYVHCK